MADTGLDIATVRERFEASTDFTVGLEEEFAIVDPESLELAQRFEELSPRARRTRSSPRRRPAS